MIEKVWKRIAQYSEKFVRQFRKNFHKTWKIVKKFLKNLKIFTKIEKKL